MKKFIIGFFAIIMAAGLTAFAITSNKVQGQPELTNLYWYEVTYDEDFPDGVIMSSTAERFGGVSQTQSYADANDGCIGTVKHCLRGFASPLPSFPSTATPADATTKN